MNRAMQRAVTAKLAQWNVESRIQAARYLRQGAIAETVQYPTGLLMVRVTGNDGCVAEISPQSLDDLRANNFKIAVPA